MSPTRIGRFLYDAPRKSHNSRKRLATTIVKTAKTSRTNGIQETYFFLWYVALHVRIRLAIGRPFVWCASQATGWAVSIIVETARMTRATGIQETYFFCLWYGNLRKRVWLALVRFFVFLHKYTAVPSVRMKKLKQAFLERGKRFFFTVMAAGFDGTWRNFFVLFLDNKGDVSSVLNLNAYTE